MTQALIVGGTYGLGLALALAASRRGITPIICGRSVDDPRRRHYFPEGAVTRRYDATAPGDRIRQIATEFPEINYVVYCSGELLHGDFATLPDEDIDRVMAINLIGPMKLVRDFHAVRRAARRPYHLTIIGSTSAFRLRADQEVYCASKAGFDHFARNFADRLTVDLPGSRTLIVNPGGMTTELFEKSGLSTSGFMDPTMVAALIWDEIVQQGVHRHEINLLRGNNGSCTKTIGPQKPEGLINKE